MTPETLVALRPPSTASVEKQIETDVRLIRLAIKGNERARNLFFAYAAIAGALANHIMEIADHGEGEKILNREFPESARATLYNWRQFAKDLLPSLSKSPTVGLLEVPIGGKKNIPVKTAEAIQQAVMETMDGKGMVEFMRSCKALREPEPVGGDRGGRTRKINAEEQAQAAEDALQIYAGWLKTIIDDRENFILCKMATINDLEDLRLAVGRKIQEIKKERTK